MVSRKDLLHLSFYQKSPFLGSDGPLRYRIEKAEVEVPSDTGTDDTGDGSGSSDGAPEAAENTGEGADNNVQKTVLKVTIWPGPFSYDKTPEEKMSSKNFEFSEDALDEICEWISKKTASL